MYRIVSALFFVATLVVIHPIQGALISENYGDYVGETLIFSNVVESSATDDVPLYGEPSVILDTLLFDPPLFGSYSSNGTSDITDGKLDLHIEAKPGYWIDSISLSEFGDVSIIGHGTDGTSASVAAPLFIRVEQIDGTPITPFTIPVVSSVTPSDGDWNLQDDGPITGEIWSGLSEVSITDYLLARGITGHATKIKFTMDNTLTTSSEPGTSAYIMKKDGVGISVITVVSAVPEPGAWLLLSVGIGFFLIAKKRFGF